MRVSTATVLTVALDREGQGSYCAFALQPDGGRVRCGTVLGGHGVWRAELIGRSPSVRLRSLSDAAKHLVS